MSEELDAMEKAALDAADMLHAMAGGWTGAQPELDSMKFLIRSLAASGRRAASRAVDAEGERTEYEFDVIVEPPNGDVMPVASTWGADRERALGEAMGYARQYLDEGNVKVYEVTRREVAALTSAGGK